MVKHTLSHFLWLLALLILVGCTVLPLPTVTEEVTPTGVEQSPQITRTQTPAVSPTGSPIPSYPDLDISSLPKFSDLAAGWNQIDAGGTTSCARGGKYSFSVRKANSDKLLVYFEGGGSCYDAKTCRVGADYFDDSIDPAYEADNPALKSFGLFDLNDIRNPFRDYNIVFINYCTGDAFIGDKTVVYSDDNNAFQVNHFGFINTQTVFSWIYKNIPKPESVFMVGCSAGVVGSYFNAPYFMQHYKGVPIALVGDSGGGYLDGPLSYTRNFGTLDLFPNWIPQYQEMVSGDLFRTQYLFTIPAQVYPSARYGLIDTEDDNVQNAIVKRIGANATLKDVLKSNMAALHAETPNIYSYAGPGDYHCITMQSIYYDYMVGGIKLNDWVTSFINGQPLQNVGP